MTLRPPWLAEAAVGRLLAALAADGIEARFVGGCVRDALIGIAAGDIDLATPARPETVIAALTAARIKALPTGLAHGTVTAVLAPRTFEITTLRRDVETDGRHAIVAFDAGWAEDAARRDFTINAIYLAPDGTLYDPVGGRADLAARHVRFVGDAATRIAEDVLRILRYYRFEARFGAGEGDAPARAACRNAAGKLPTLSAERVSRELLRLLATPDPIRALTMMRDDGVLAAILSEATRLDRLERLLPLSSDPPLRLAALIEVDRAQAVGLAERLRLPAKDQKRLADLAKPWQIDLNQNIERLRVDLYLFEGPDYRDIALLAASEGQITADRLGDLLEWSRPDFPLNGRDVTGLGIPPGPRVRQLLTQIRRWFAEGGFAANRDQCLARLKELAEQP